MLSENDKAYVIEVLADEIGGAGNMRQSISAPFFGTSLAQDLVPGNNAREIAIDAVRLCIMDGWNHQPTWMEKLLNIFQLRVQNSKIDEIWERSKKPPPEAVNPLDLTILNNDTPFVNRVRLRAILKKLDTPAANLQPILVLNGDPQCGKSYSTNYIDHYNNITASATNYRLKFDPELGPGMGAEQIAKDLVFAMGRPINNMPAPETNIKLYTRQLATWVLNEAAQLSSKFWFVFDNFGGESLRPDTKNFLLELSDRITTGVYSQRCRLILIGFDRAHLTVEPGKVDEEKIEACKEADVVSSVIEILKRAIRPVSLQNILPNIVSNLPSGPDQMCTLNWRLRALLMAINEMNIVFPDIETNDDNDYEKILLNILDGLPEGKNRVTELENELNVLSNRV